MKSKKWETKKLGEVCTFVRGPFGGSLKKSLFTSSGYAVYEQQHAIYNTFSNVRYFINESKFEEMKRFAVKSGDIIMSCSGTMGKTAIVPQSIKKGIINQALLKLTPTNKILNTFLNYYMHSEIFKALLSKRTSGVAIKNVASVSALKNIVIPMPSISEQQKIVEKLDKLFAEIDKAKQLAQTNLKNNSNLLSALLSSILTTDKEWQLKNFEDVCKNISAGGDKPEKVSATKTTVCPIPIYANAIQDDGLYGYTNKPVITTPAVTISARGTIGYPSIKRHPFYPIVRLIVASPDSSKILLEYLYYLVKVIVPIGNGTSIPQLTIPMFKKLMFPLPSVSKQQKIVDKLDKLSAETKKMEEIYKKKIADLEELKKSLLKQAFEGKLV